MYERSLQLPYNCKFQLTKNLHNLFPAPYFSYANNVFRAKPNFSKRCHRLFYKDTLLVIHTLNRTLLGATVTFSFFPFLTMQFNS